MEETIALLIADLSGYTALTETHGAGSAADLIDKYIYIVQDCLTGSSQLHERTGDEVMIVASSADHLLTTAQKMLKYSVREHNFLQIHGGLHYGTVLNRNNSYFGSALNLTARIAAAASPGSFLCSHDFINAMKDKTESRFRAKGKFHFRNVSGETELSEISHHQGGFLAIDPVCRMLVLDPSQAFTHPEQQDLFFCSQHCLDHYQESQSAPSLLQSCV